MTYFEITGWSVVARILASIFVGGLIGLERGMKNRPAGLRTYMLVCVGACLIMLTNQYIYQFTGAGDPMRLGAQVVSGIGFLGAGTIVVTRHSQIKGLTTAAGLWACAGVGLALGVGFYEAAVTATVGIYLILTVLQRWEHKTHRKIRTIEIYVELSSHVQVYEFTKKIRELDLQIEELYFETDGILEDNNKGLILVLKSKKREDHRLLCEDLKKMDGVVQLEEL